MLNKIVQFLIVLFFLALLFAQAYTYGDTLQAGISNTRVLPSSETKWKVTATLLETNAPNRFKEVSRPIWILREKEGKITLSNPRTTAIDTIDIDDVEDYYDGELMFGYTYHTTSRIVSEHLNFRLNGDTFEGITLMEYTFKKSKPLYYYAKYKIVGQRIK
jgi:hypothetical protein